MNALQQAITWLNDPLNWTNPDGILTRTYQHLWLSAAAVLLACLVAWPIGIWFGHTGRGGGVTVVVANVTRAIPTLALLTVFPLVAFIGFGSKAVILALAIFAVPPLLANAYLGLREVDPDVKDAARGMGLSTFDLLWRVELPLAVPYLATGLRTAAVQVVATAPLAAWVNGGGLGTIIRQGFGLGFVEGSGQILAGAMVVILLCLLVEGGLALLQRTATPRALRTAARRKTVQADPALQV